MVRLRSIFLALALLAFQLVGTAHAAEWGNAPHTHDGVVCDVALVAEEVEAALPATVSVPPLPDDFAADWTDAVPTRAVVAPPARAPPPRGPPAST